MPTRRLSRRQFLRRLTLGAGLSVLAACSAGAPGADEPTAGSTTTPPGDAVQPTASAPNAEPPMVRIPGGTYTIGADDGPPDARPAHAVTLAPFLIDVFEVTNTQYAVFLNTLGIPLLADAPAGRVTVASFRPKDAPRFLEGAEGGERPELLIALDDNECRIGVTGGRFAAQPGFEEHPVAETTWRGAVAYARWRGARLPTEAEWEVAARGTTGRLYPWGDTPPSAERAVFGRRSGETAPVGAHPRGATPEGLHDLSGNLAEWTSSLYRPYPYRADDGREDPESPEERVTRGGDHVFDVAPEQLTTIFRQGFSRAPDRGHRHIGFRCARSLPDGA